jgi:hypothetical protein
MKKKYKVMSPLSVGSKNEKGQSVYTRYLIDEEVELNDEQAAVLLERNAIAPAVVKKTSKKEE